MTDLQWTDEPPSLFDGIKRGLEQAIDREQSFTWLLDEHNEDTEYDYFLVVDRDTLNEVAKTRTISEVLSYFCLDTEEADRGKYIIDRKGQKYGPFSDGMQAMEWLKGRATDVDSL